MRVSRRRIAVAVAGAAFPFAVVLAALRVGEAAGKLSDWQALILGSSRERPSCCPSRRLVI